MAGAVPDLASGSVGSPHHLWVGRVAFGWLLWIAWQTGLLYDSNDMQVTGWRDQGICEMHGRPLVMLSVCQTAAAAFVKHG